MTFFVCDMNRLDQPRLHTNIMEKQGNCNPLTICLSVRSRIVATYFPAGAAANGY